MPAIRLTGYDTKEYGQILQKPQETLGEALRRAGYPVEFPCGGRGTCGKCRCQVVAGRTELSEEEKKLLTKEELERGERLLCRCVFLTDGAVRLPESSGAIAGASLMGRTTRTGQEPSAEAGRDYEVAVDIGTTTIAMALRECGSGQVTEAITKNNSQRCYGADVLSRVAAAKEGHQKEMQMLVWQDVLAGLDTLMAGKNGRVRRMAVAANTTMQHIFAGDSCEGLGAAPFTPVSLALRRYTGAELYPKIPQEYANLEVILLPGISAFIGADIVSGMYACEMVKSSKPVLLLDIGTNGEMVLGDENGFLATAAAAGPALEGAGISCGTAGVAGAVNSVSLLGNRMVMHTIGEKKPVGLCGTGVLELAYELVKQGIVDKTGTFQENYRENGYPVAVTADGKQLAFTQEDMRQLQMAKAAIRSGIELLLTEKGLSPEEVSAVYLAGGLGYKLNAYKAAGIGLLPVKLRDKAVAVGNSSLSGALKYLEQSEDDKLKQLVERTREMNLAAHPGFESLYYQNMNFGQ